jgi:predicted metal-dependent phosphoesterase TrpH
MLGYFIDWRDAQFQKRLEVIREGRVSRMYKMIEKLKGAGIDIESDKVIKMAGRGSVGRLHLARAMLEAKQIKTLEEAFRKYIGFLKPCYVRNIHFTPQEAIDLILKMKGVPVIAHPFTMKRDDLVSEFVEYGIRGIEVYHTDHDSVTTKHYKQMAEEYGLIATGGSDCHGLGKGKILMGGIRVPFSVVAQLKLEASKVA